MRPELTAVLGVKRFLKEIEVTANLHHPHILPLFDSGEADTLLYYVMPYVADQSLREKLVREGRLSLEEAVRIFAEVGSALDYAHRHGVIHRDVKPENILLHDGRGLVSDFGIALSTGSDTSARMTGMGLAMGTPHCMSPEQAAGVRDLDARTDVYALGVILYEMVAGEPPTPRFARTLSAEGPTGDPQSLAQRRPETPHVVSSAVARALALNPAARFQTVREFVAAAEGGASSPRPLERSIAVVPFEYLGADSSEAFLADGLAEEIITDLSRLPGVRVISRGSCFRLKRASAVAAGRELGVRYVLEGSLRRAGQSLRINAQLVDVADGRALWGERFNTTMDDIVTVQEQMARAIVDVLRVKLSPEDVERLAARPIIDVTAYECYLRARHELWQLSDAAFGRARALLEEGLTLVGDNVLLLATLGELWVSAHEFGLKPGEQSLREAERCAERTSKVDPQAPTSLLLRGLVDYKRGRMQHAIDALKAVLDAEPGNVDALTWLCAVYFITGRTQAAAPLATRLKAADPLTPICVAGEGFVDAFAGRLKAAAPRYQRWYERDPENPFARFCFGAMLGGLGGRDTEARAVLDALARDVPGHVLAMLGTFLANALRGERDAAYVAVTPVLEEAVRTTAYLTAFMAGGYAALDDHDRALEWLETGLCCGMAASQMIERMAYLHTLRPDPRFRDLMVRMRDYSGSLWT